MMTDTHTKSKNGGEKRTVTVAPAARRRHSTAAGSTTVAPTVHRTVAPGTLSPTAAAVTSATRRPTWLIAASAALILAVVAGFVLGSRSAGPGVAAEPVAVFEIVRGSVEVTPDVSRPTSSRLLTLETDRSILPGTVVETRSADESTTPSRTAIRLANGASVRLDTDTRVQVASESVLNLERGALYIDAAEEGASVEVWTTLGVVRDIGTQFEVRLLPGSDTQETLRVRIREGAVVLQRDGASHEARAGAELAMRRDGTLARDSVPIHGAHWGWVLGSAPVPEIEGRPLIEFLEWVTREGGWTLRFADRETEDMAPKTTMHGDVGELTPEEGAGVVLRGSDLEYRLVDGTFWVGPTGFEPGQP